MQLLCQRNSLNLRSFTVQEIAEVSEILIVQKNDGALITSSAEATQYEEGRRPCVECGVSRYEALALISQQKIKRTVVSWHNSYSE
jgi:hypothetical protein